MKNSRSLVRVSSERFLRQTIGSDGISGEVQITFSCAALSGAVTCRRSMPSLLKVPTSTCLLATDSALTSWLPFSARLKILLASTLFWANT
ncbi:hypothetical protein D9M68_900980 [compost metagenome]